MRYNVHSPCAFHSRIAKTLGVLVGAALVATLGLPRAAQAQTPAAPTVTGTGDGETAARRKITAIVGERRLLPRGAPTGCVAARIYRAWRTMGRCDVGGRSNCFQVIVLQNLSPRMTPGSIMVSGDFACRIGRRDADG